MVVTADTGSACNKNNPSVFLTRNRVYIPLFEGTKWFDCRHTIFSYPSPVWERIGTLNNSFQKKIGNPRKGLTENSETDFLF